MSLVRTGFGIAHSGGRRQFRRGSTLLMVPAIVLLVAFYLLPNVLNLLLGLTNWNAFKSDTKFVGLGNFQTLADTNVLSNAVVTTLLFAAAAMVLVNVLGLAFALGLERTTRSNGVLRTLFLIPVLISPVAAGFVARGLLAPEGPVNAALSSVLGGTVDIAWFGSTDYTLYVLVFVQVWKSLGVVMLIYLAGLMAIPAELVAAARVDGATARQVITKVKLPLLGAALTANVVLSLIGGRSAGSGNFARLDSCFHRGNADSIAR